MSTTTGDSPERLTQLKTVPDNNKNNLVKIHAQIRQQFNQLLEK